MNSYTFELPAEYKPTHQELRQFEEYAKCEDFDVYSIMVPFKRKMIVPVSFRAFDAKI